MYIKVAIHILVLINSILSLTNFTLKDPHNELGDHTLVTDSNVFPYVCAILKKSTYISAGALIDASWVITGGDALFLLRESARELRVRMGSINYRKGGVLMPIKYFEIHPYFSDTKPDYDIALIKLPQPVRLSPRLNPIRLQKKKSEVTATHFIVTSWPTPAADKSSAELQRVLSKEMIKRRRILTVTHLHPSDHDRCMEEMEGLEINATNAVMCLDAAPENDPCYRDVGAPVVLNGILWGIISSWKSEDCQLESSSSFVNLVSAPEISPWIHDVVGGHRWNISLNHDVVEEDVDDDYDYYSGEEDSHPYEYEKNEIESLRPVSHQTYVGAPMVLNGTLWGVISSWKPEDCQLEGSSSFVNLVSAPEISPWIHAVVQGHRWNKSLKREDVDDNYDDDNVDEDEDEKKNEIDS